MCKITAEVIFTIALGVISSALFKLFVDCDQNIRKNIEFSISSNKEDILLLANRSLQSVLNDNEADPKTDKIVAFLTAGSTSEIIQKIFQLKFHQNSREFSQVRTEFIADYMNIIGDDATHEEASILFEGILDACGKIIDYAIDDGTLQALSIKMTLQHAAMREENLKEHETTQTMIQQVRDEVRNLLPELYKCNLDRQEEEIRKIKESWLSSFQSAFINALNLCRQFQYADSNAEFIRLADSIELTKINRVNPDPHFIIEKDLKKIEVFCHFNIASNYLHLNKPEKCIEELHVTKSFAKEIGFDPQFIAGVVNNIGYTLAKIGRFSEAITAFNETIQIKPDIADAYTNLGLVLLDIKEYENAKRAFEDALENGGDISKYHFGMGKLHLVKGEYAAAESAVRKAMNLKPDYEDAIHMYGVLLDITGRLHEATELFKEIIKKNPHAALAYGSLGTTLLNQGNLLEAKAALQKAVELDPTNASAFGNLGAALGELGEHEGAEQAMKSAIQLDPVRTEFLRNYRILSYTVGRPDEGERAIREALHKCPHDWNIRRELVVLYTEQQKYRDAEAELKLALDSDPGCAELHEFMGFVLVKDERYCEAESIFLSASKILFEQNDIPNSIRMFWNLISLYRRMM